MFITSLRDCAPGIGTGLPGLTGRQISIDPQDASDPATVAALALVEEYAKQGRITAVATGHHIVEMRYDPASEAWLAPSGWMQTTDEMRDLAVALNTVITVTADLPGEVGCLIAHSITS